MVCAGVTMEAQAKHEPGHVKGQRKNQAFGQKRGNGQFAAIRASLTADQKQQLKAMRQQNKVQFSAQREQLQALRAQAKAASTKQERQAIRAQLKALRAQVKAQRQSGMMSILTPAQRAQLAL